MQSKMKFNTQPNTQLNPQLNPQPLAGFDENIERQENIKWNAKLRAVKEQLRMLKTNREVIAKYKKEKEDERAKTLIEIAKFEQANVCEQAKVGVNKQSQKRKSCSGEEGASPSKSKHARGSEKQKSPTYVHSEKEKEEEKEEEEEEDYDDEIDVIQMHQTSPMSPNPKVKVVHETTTTTVVTKTSFELEEDELIELLRQGLPVPGSPIKTRVTIQEKGQKSPAKVSRQEFVNDTDDAAGRYMMKQRLYSMGR
jgi:hypothetical protein